MSVLGGLVQTAVGKRLPVLLDLPGEFTIDDRAQRVLVDTQQRAILPRLVPRHAAQALPQPNQQVSSVLDIALGVARLNTQALQEALAARAVSQEAGQPLQRSSRLASRGAKIARGILDRLDAVGRGANPLRREI
ncbi:hypothetical protein D9M69_494530 [compost metagenome]